MPIIELTKAAVEGKKDVRLRGKKREAAETSFGNSSDTLRLSPMRLFHAAVKTRFAASFTQDAMHEAAVEFGAANRTRLVWGTGNLRKSDTDVLAHAEFDEATLAGRFGEAIAYLTMIKFGYAYWDRCTTVWARAAKAAKLSHAEQLRAAKFLKSKFKARTRTKHLDKEPDFVFETKGRQVALMESKGSFVDPGKDNPSTKGDLKGALVQLTSWSKLIRPAPKKSFAIGTYLRDESDKADPSLVAWVDPEGEQDDNLPAVALPPDLIRRCNYAAWLDSMGIGASATALREGLEKPREQVALPVFRMGDREFAVTVLGLKYGPGVSLRPHPFWLDLPFPLDLWSFGLREPRGALVLGLDAGVLKAVGEAISQPHEATLLNLDVKDVEVAARGTYEPEDDSQRSVMPDGSFVGLLSRSELESLFRSVETFDL